MPDLKDIGEVQPFDELPEEDKKIFNELSAVVKTEVDPEDWDDPYAQQFYYREYEDGTRVKLSIPKGRIFNAFTWYLSNGIGEDAKNEYLVMALWLLLYQYDESRKDELDKIMAGINKEDKKEPYTLPDEMLTGDIQAKVGNLPRKVMYYSYTMVDMFKWIMGMVEGDKKKVPTVRMNGESG